MTKARREMESKLRLIDFVIEVLDARIPASSLNPDFDGLFDGKKRLYVLNREDMADPEATGLWVQHFREKGESAVSFSAKTSDPKILKKAISDCTRPIYEKYLKKGMKKTVRALVTGIPNVGKSAVINRLSGGKKLKVANTPGITKDLSWVKIGEYLELADTPGMLPPKITDVESGVKIAAAGSIKTDILDTGTIALELLGLVEKAKPGSAAARYGCGEDPEEVLTAICRSRSFYREGEPDTERAALTVLDDFKNARFGRITLERP